MNLSQIIPAEQFRRVFSQEMCDIDPEFLGFIEVYEHLAEIIPQHFTVVDLGCAYAPQAFYFQNHLAYVGVDCFARERFCAKNTRHYHESIEEFIQNRIGEFDLEETFAICSYVPSRTVRELVRMTFPNLFVYYPSDKHNRYLPDLKLGKA